MSVTAKIRPSARPGNAFTRRLAGLPAPPKTGSVGAVFDPTIANSIIEYGVLPPPDISLDQCVKTPTRNYIETGWPEAEIDLVDISISEFEIGEVTIDRFGAFQINGANFAEDRKVGTPIDDPRVQAAARKAGYRGRSTTAPLLAQLLPILLPPARARFGDVFDLPSDLYTYQRDGIQWLIEHEPAALLADDMGLGKTVQVAVALRQLFRTGKILRALIVAPRSVITSWRRHMADWAPELQVVAIDGSRTERRIAWTALWNQQAHVGVVTYDSLRIDEEFCQRGSLSVVVFDEIHFCKNPDTARARAAKSIRADRRWGLTGTPLENKVDDFANILTILDSTIRFGKAPSPRAVRNAASKIMIRRRIGDVLTDLPELSSHIEYIDILPVQRQAYDDAETLGVNRLRAHEVSITNVLALITALKQICNGVDIHSAKAEWLTNYLDNAQNAYDKTLVFSQYVTSLNTLNRSLSNFRPLQYVGRMTPKQKQLCVDTFQNSPDNHVMLVSLRAGGVGLNLTAANRVVHYDSWWNPAVMNQATARIRRIGQKKQMFETTLVASNTVEERIQRILDDKRTLFANVVDDLSVEGISSALTQEELYSLFGINVTTPTQKPTLTEQPIPAPDQEVPPPTKAITPATPFSNVLAIRQIIRSCRGTVLWVDPNFSRRGLEDLRTELELDDVQEIRIISRDISPKDLRDFERFHAELKQLGIDADWRSFNDRRLFHDRFLADDASCHNVPPVNLIYDRNAPYSEINESSLRPPLDEWWQIAETVRGD